MNWLVYCLTLVETNVVSIERIAEYTDTESEVSVSYLKKNNKKHDLYYSLCYNILVGLQISNNRYPGSPWYPFINPLCRGPQGFIVACKYACS